MWLLKDTLKCNTTNKGHKITALYLHNTSVWCIGSLTVVLSVGESENMVIISYGLRQYFKKNKENNPFQNQTFSVEMFLWHWALGSPLVFLEIHELCSPLCAKLVGHSSVTTEHVYFSQIFKKHKVYIIKWLSQTSSKKQLWSFLSLQICLLRRGFQSLFYQVPF